LGRPARLATLARLVSQAAHAGLHPAWLASCDHHYYGSTCTPHTKLPSLCCLTHAQYLPDHGGADTVLRRGGQGLDSRQDRTQRLQVGLEHVTTTTKPGLYCFHQHACSSALIRTHTRNPACPRLVATRLPLANSTPPDLIMRRNAAPEIDLADPRCLCGCETPCNLGSGEVLTA
jgi:hypothetical protein